MTAGHIDRNRLRVSKSDRNPPLEETFFPKGSEPMEKLLSYREPLLTTAAVAKWLGISTRAVCLWAECKVIPAIKVGRQWRFRHEEISHWLQHSEASSVRNPTNKEARAARV